MPQCHVVIHINIIYYCIFSVSLLTTTKQSSPSPTMTKRSCRSASSKAQITTFPTTIRITTPPETVYNLTKTNPMTTKSFNVSLNTFNVYLSHNEKFYSPSTTSAIVLSVNSEWKMQYEVTGKPSRLILTVVHNGNNTRLLAGRSSFIIKSNVKKSDSGMYEVIAQNGKTKKPFYFNVQVLVTSNVPLHVHTTNTVTATLNGNTIQSKNFSQGGGKCISRVLLLCNNFCTWVTVLETSLFTAAIIVCCVSSFIFVVQTVFFVYHHRRRLHVLVRRVLCLPRKEQKSMNIYICTKMY